MHKHPASPLLIVSATRRVVSVAGKGLVPPVRLCRDTDIRSAIPACSQATVAGTAKPGSYFIGNQQNAFAIAHVTNTYEPLWMIYAHPARALNDRFQGTAALFHGDARPSGGQKWRDINFHPIRHPSRLCGAARTQILRRIAFPHKLCMGYGSHTDIAPNVSP